MTLIKTVSQVQTLRELAIEDPKKYLNDYCEILSKTPGIKTTKVNQRAKKDLEGQVPESYFTNYVDKKFKDPSQLRKGKLRHQEKLTKEAKIKRFAGWLKKQKSDVVDSYYQEASSTIDPETQLDSYLRNRK